MLSDALLLHVDEHPLPAGSFSRSAVNNASGAKTQLAGVFTALIVMAVLLFLTPVFALVPYNAIGAIIIAGCTTLFEYKVAAQLWRVSCLQEAAGYRIHVVTMS